MAFASSEICNQQEPQAAASNKYEEALWEVVTWLIHHNYPALPVAPAQAPHKYPKTNKKGEIEYEEDGQTPKRKFTGKNPSYLDSNGIPRLINHRKFQTKLPKKQEVENWFENPLNGIGTLGGWNDTIWLDFDVKQFPNQEECDEAALKICEAVSEQTEEEPFLERTHSGGWRIGVRVKQKPDFTNFALTPGGKHVGEALGEGRFTVLAPTIGPSDNPYQSINRTEPPEIESLESIGIYAKRKNKSTSQPKQLDPLPPTNISESISPPPTNICGSIPLEPKQPAPVPPTNISGSIPLEKLGSKSSQEFLSGSVQSKDRSSSLVAAAREWYGWENWAAENGIGISGNADELINDAGSQLNIESDRIPKIIQNIDQAECKPAAYFKGGDEACWKKIRSVDKAVFKAKCPADIKDSLKAQNKQSKNPTGKGDQSQSNSDNEFHPPTRKQIKSFCQQMYSDLFEDENYIYVFRKIHQWVGTHYEPIHDAEIIKKIHNYCNAYEVLKVDKETEAELVTYPFADPKYVKKAFEWIKQKFGIDPSLVNPPGLNCVDGILQLSFDPDSQKWIRTLIPHEPAYYYLYAPQVSYTIPAVVLPDSCDRLLSCLDEPQREIFLKTIGAALDLQTVRRYRGREIRGLLLHGFGNNGKDTLREVTAMMFGFRGMVSASLSDFQQYDQGRKFPLQKLDGALVNWPSENADCMMIDRLQSLKIAITGDPISGEQKGKDEYLFRPRCINLFNVNALPKLQGSMEAIASRFAILKFTKTYKSNPGPGELQADPRFLYDPDFVRTEVLPWYLHYCLDALDQLMSEGIDYEITEQAWEDLKTETDHIYAFCREVGIGYKPNGQLGADEVCEKLREWYIENGALEVEEFDDGRKRDNWSPNPAWGDNLVKGRNQIFPRLLKIFPQARRERDSSGRNILVGIGWVAPTPPNGELVSEGYISEDGLKMSEDGLKMVKPSDIKASEDAEDDLGFTREKKITEIEIEVSCDCGGNCPGCVSDSARNLANAFLHCNSVFEVKALAGKYHRLKEAAWRQLTKEQRKYLRDLMTEGGVKNANSKNEAPPPNHLQHLQNADSVRDEASSVHLQSSSDHVQKSINEIQNEASEEVVEPINQVSDQVGELAQGEQAAQLEINLEQPKEEADVGYETVQPSSELRQVFAPVSDPEARYTIVFRNSEKFSNCRFLISPQHNVFKFLSEEKYLLTLFALGKFNNDTRLYLQQPLEAAPKNDYQVFEEGDQVLHEKFGLGVVMEQIKDMVLCQFPIGRRSPYAWELKLAEVPKTEKS